MKTIAVKGQSVSQCKKPHGLLGRLVLRNMNSRHSKVTDWGLGHIVIPKDYVILDVGCGGGRTLSKLAERVTEGKAYGIDYSKASVAASKRTNARWLEIGRVDVLHGSVSQLPFPDAMFDLVTAIETHFWWPDLPTDMLEICRVIKPGGKLIIIAEVYRGANTKMARMCEKYAALTGMTLLDVNGHRELFARATYSAIELVEKHAEGWICVIGTKP